MECPGQRDYRGILVGVGDEHVFLGLTHSRSVPAVLSRIVQNVWHQSPWKHLKHSILCPYVSVKRFNVMIFPILQIYNFFLVYSAETLASPVTLTN